MLELVTLHVLSLDGLEWTEEEVAVQEDEFTFLLELRGLGMGASEVRDLSG